MSSGLVLACKVCRWRPPNDLEMNLVRMHFDLEPDHDPENVTLELVCVCARCDLEMPLESRTASASGRVRDTFACSRCHRTKTISRREEA